MFPRFLTFLVYLNLTLLLACSGGTGGTGSGGGGGGGTGNNVVVGTITDVSTSSSAATATGVQTVAAATASSGNTVTINGIQFDVSSSTITLDGVNGTEADLRAGMVATIKGSVDANGTTGIADSLSVKEVVIGQVTFKDATNNYITVLGQTIQASATTQWNNVANISGLNVNDIVEVSGYAKNNNVIAATRVEKLTGNETEFKATGTIANVTATTFDLGSLTVDYSNAVLSNIPNGTPTTGMFVEVKFQLINNQLNATHVSSETLEVSDADSIELQGFVTSTSGMPVTSFSVNNQQVQIDANTLFSGGSTADIIAGVQVDVTGPLANGVLTADQISFEDSVKITAVVDTVSANSFTLIGFGALSISSDASTEFDDTISSIVDLATGNTVTVHGNLATAGEVTATQITLESDTPSADVSLQGPVDAIASDSVTIIGINIDTQLFADADFMVEGTTNNSRVYFFSLVTTGTVITAQGTLTGNTLSWQSLLYENPNN
jgi:hypothetical protein